MQCSQIAQNSTSCSGSTQWQHIVAKSNVELFWELEVLKPSILMLSIHVTESSGQKVYLEKLLLCPESIQKAGIKLAIKKRAVAIRYLDLENEECKMQVMFPTEVDAAQCHGMLNEVFLSSLRSLAIDSITPSKEAEKATNNQSSSAMLSTLNSLHEPNKNVKSDHPEDDGSETECEGFSPTNRKLIKGQGVLSTQPNEKTSIGSQLVSQCSDSRSKIAHSLPNSQANENQSTTVPVKSQSRSLSPQMDYESSLTQAATDTPPNSAHLKGKAPCNYSATEAPSSLPLCEYCHCSYEQHLIPTNPMSSASAVSLLFRAAANPFDPIILDLQNQLHLLDCLSRQPFRQSSTQKRLKQIVSTLIP